MTRRREAEVNVLAQTVSLNMNLPALLALVAGILILVIPRLLNYIVAAYLIVIGLIGLLNL